MEKQLGKQETERLSLRGCACGCENTLSLSGAALSRRRFMQGVAGAATLAAAGIGRPSGALAQAAEAKPYRIDVHHHLSPPSYIAESIAKNFGEPLMRKWRPENSRAGLDA